MKIPGRNLNIFLLLGSIAVLSACGGGGGGTSGGEVIPEPSMTIDVDTGFNSTGFVILNGTAGGNSTDIGYDVIVDANNRSLVAGASRDASNFYHLAVWRFLPDGSLDTTFGNVDLSSNDPAVRLGYTLLSGLAGGTRDVATSIMVDGDGYIVAGHSSRAVDLQGVADVEAVVVRLTSTGSLDTAFGDADPGSTDAAIKLGYSVFPLTGFDFVNDISKDSLNRIILAGTILGPLNNYDVAVWRFKPDGVIDNSFGDDDPASGDPLVKLGYMQFSATIAEDGHDDAFTVKVDSQDRILVGGGIFRSAGSTYDPFVWRLTSAGVLDDSFGDDDPGSTDPAVKLGYTVLTLPGDLGVHDKPVNLHILPDDSIWAGGNSRLSNQPITVIWKLDANGTADSSFGTDYDSDGVKDGYVIHSDLASEASKAYVQDGSGNIYAIGSGTNGMFVIKFDASGNYDASFNGDSGHYFWTHPVSGKSGAPLSAALDNLGDLMITGSYTDANLDMALWKVKLTGSSTPVDPNALLLNTSRSDTLAAGTSKDYVFTSNTSNTLYYVYASTYLTQFNGVNGSACTHIFTDNRSIGAYDTGCVLDNLPNSTNHTINISNPNSGEGTVSLLVIPDNQKVRVADGIASSESLPAHGAAHYRFVVPVSAAYTLTVDGSGASLLADSWIFRGSFCYSGFTSDDRCMFDSTRATFTTSALTAGDVVDIVISSDPGTAFSLTFGVSI